MAKTVLAVDDSVTMRKVLEITFSGEDFRVITAESAQSALSKASEADVFLIDTTLGGDDGYALARELRKVKANAPVVLLASRYNPYDQAKGRDAGADDFADKPFDTQSLIDKVKKVLAQKEASPRAASIPAMPAASPQPAPVAAAPAPAAARPPAPPAPPAFAGVPRPAAAAAGVPSAPRVPVAAPPMASAPAAAASAPGSVATHVNGHMAGKLADLGLTAEQANGVLALSREVIERVVWEVVPQLAETLIKEEIGRLTRA